MPPRVEPRAFVNFSVRLDLASNERRRRLENALGLSAPRLLERIFCNFENQLLSQFSDTHRDAYLAGELDAGKSHLRASSISTAKDAKNSYECRDLRVASLGDFGTLRNEGGGL